MKKGIHLICRLQSGSMNKEMQAFWGSKLMDTTITYTPSYHVERALKRQGHQLDFNSIKLRLFKYKIDDELYVCATTLIGKQYPLNEFPRVYHGRWGIEELYKISKQFVQVEDFHGKSIVDINHYINHYINNAYLDSLRITSLFLYLCFS